MFARTLVAPLDALRSVVLRVVLSVLGAWGRALLVDRSLRVTIYGALGVGLAAATTLLAPLWTFALGPLVLGVPHLLADVRYLVVQPGLHRRTALAFTVGVPLVAATLLASPLWGLGASLGVIAFARTTPSRRVALLVVGSFAMLAAWYAPLVTTLALVHGHNVVAIALFAFVFARSKRSAWALTTPFVAVSLALFSGMLDPLVVRAFSIAGPTTGLGLSDVIDSVAPVADPMLGARLALFFVFAQGVHYLVWLRLVPEDARERPGLRSFASSLRALRADVGLFVLGLAFVAAVLVGARALVSLESARMFYLRVAGAHAYLELAFACLFVLEGRALLTRSADARV